MSKLTTLAASTILAAGFASIAMAEGDAIRIGVVTPISGTYAGIGQQVTWGLDMAAAEINANGGIMGRQIELVYEDSEANPAVAVQKALDIAAGREILALGAQHDHADAVVIVQGFEDKAQLVALGH